MQETHPAVAVSIWCSVAAWGFVMVGRCRGREMPGALALWIAGWIAFAIHVATAFAIHYRWSHEVAVAETSRQTRELTGFDSGVGLWWNYLFGVVWAIDASRWIATGDPVAGGRGKWPHRLAHGFLTFMIFNGTIVFAGGATRIFGILLFLGLAATLLWRRTRPSLVSDPTLSGRKDRLFPPSS